MANEYVINAADAVSVADVIREKAEITDKLNWPEGWKDAIRGIKSGVELNFEIVGGTNQPENPKENTIWVNTDQEITEWAFSVEEPSEFIQGLVWIETHESSAISFDMLTENTVILHLLNVKQYNGSGWDIKETKIYQSGTWVNVDSGYLFKDGESFILQTGGWTADGISFTGYTVASGYISNDRGMILLPTVDSSTITLVCTVNKIDLNGVDIIEIDAITDGRQHSVVCLSTSRVDVAASRVSYAVLNNDITQFPIESFNESYYIVLYLDGGSSTSGNVTGIRSVKLIRGDENS